MTNSTKGHYDNHLSSFYAWMTGDFDGNVGAQRKFFEDHSIIGHPTALAVDLGCGHGIHSIALAQLGFSVDAVDFSEKMLEQLHANKGALPVTTHQSEIIKYLEELESLADIIVCMGDTLTHLESLANVATMFQLASERLKPGGKLVLSWRDMTHPLEGSQRFIPVRSDGDKIHTCFLEYLEDKVRVYDLLHQHSDTGWKQSVSSYAKLRLSGSSVSEMVKSAGLTIQSEDLVNRMNHLVAQKV